MIRLLWVLKLPVPSSASCREKVKWRRWCSVRKPVILRKLVTKLAALETSVFIFLSALQMKIQMNGGRKWRPAAAAAAAAPVNRKQRRWIRTTVRKSHLLLFRMKDVQGQFSDQFIEDQVSVISNLLWLKSDYHLRIPTRRNKLFL